MSKQRVNQVESLNPVTTDLILKGKNIDLQCTAVTQNGSPLGGGGAGGGISLILDTTAVTETPLVKNTWASIMAAITAAPNVIDLFIHKPGLSLTQSVPAGTYNLSKVRINCTPETIGVILSFDDGVVLTGFPIALNGVVIETKNTSAPLFTNPSFTFIFINNGSLRTHTTAIKPVIFNGSGKTMTFIVDSAFSPFYKNGSGYEPIFNQGSISMDIYHVPPSSFFSLNDVFTNDLLGGGTITLNSYILLLDGYIATHANYNGTLNVNQREEDRLNQIIANKALHVFYFNPGLPPSGNIFNDWTALYNAIGSITGVSIIYFTSASTTFLPAGSYSFPNSIFKILGSAQKFSFADNTTIFSWPIDCEVDLEFANTSVPVTNLTAASTKASFSGTANLINNGTQPIFQTNSGGDTVDLNFKDKATMTPTAGVIAKTNAVGAPINVTLFDYAKIPVGSLESVVGGTINIKNYTLVSGGTITSVIGDSSGLVITNEYEIRVNQLVDIKYPVTWTTYVPVITAATPPTKATTTIEDTARYKIKQKDLKCIYRYEHNDNTGATDGVGNYIFSLPPGQTIDNLALSTKQVVGTARVKIGSTVYHGIVYFDASVTLTGVIVEILNDTAAPALVSATLGQLTSAAISYELNFEVPVV